MCVRRKDLLTFEKFAMNPAEGNDRIYEILDLGCTRVSLSFTFGQARVFVLQLNFTCLFGRESP